MINLSRGGGGGRSEMAVAVVEEEEGERGLWWGRGGKRSTTLFLVFKTFYTKKQSAGNNFLRIILTVELQTHVKYDLVLCVQCSKAAQMRPRGLRTESIRCF